MNNSQDIKLDLFLYQRAFELLLKAKNVLLVTHLNPDGDALGSLCFTIGLLKDKGIKYTAYCAGPLPDHFSFLPYFSEIITDKSLLKLADYDLIVSLDCGSVKRTNLLEEINARLSGQFFMEIDHHTSEEGLSDFVLRDPLAASTTEILEQIIKTAGYIPSPPLARCLLTGLVTDTGGFIYPATSRQTMFAASQMLSRGANVFKIMDNTWRTKSLPDLRLWGLALARLSVNPLYNLAFTVITEEDMKETGADHEAISGLAGFITSSPEFAAVLVLHEEDGFVRGSLRTTRDDVDVSALAKLFGGGGHTKASGFSIAGRLKLTPKGWTLEK